ncbi:MAG TPA: iron-sulfur cluster assembly protein, partial [Candidatus Polarisedimenticolia bacterium]|nr:iron-sulfur cluster assembly protein [Candidatus Polarisedimenticolia bacterium]
MSDPNPFPPFPLASGATSDPATTPAAAPDATPSLFTGREFTGPAHGKPNVQVDPVAHAIEEQVVEQLRSCYDPEIPVNIYELGLIYDIDVLPGSRVAVRMTLTSPMCPVAGSLPPDVEARIRSIPGVTDAKVEVTWEPAWGPEM